MLTKTCMTVARFSYASGSSLWVDQPRQIAVCAVVPGTTWPLIKIESAIISKSEADLAILSYDEQASRPLLNVTLQVADA